MRTQTSKERGLPEKILFLRKTSEGLKRPYRNIQSILKQEGYGKVSLGTICYHLGKGQKEKAKLRSKKSKKKLKQLELDLVA